MTKEQALRAAKSAANAALTGIQDAQNKAKYDQDVLQLQDEITGMSLAIEAVAKGSGGQDWKHLLASIGKGPSSITRSLTPPTIDPELKLLDDAERLNKGLLAYEELMNTDWTNLQKRLERDRLELYSSPFRIGGFESHKRSMEGEQVKAEVMYYEENYASDAVRIRRELLEQVPEAGYDTYPDFAHPDNGAAIVEIQRIIARYVAAFKAKLASVQKLPN